MNPPTQAPAVSLRGLLRDTALHVSLLAQRAAPDSVATLRDDCRQLVVAFDATLESRGTSLDVKHDALYAQCALLDETVSRHLPDEFKSHWDAAPLQVEWFQDHDAGNQVYERIAARMRETSPHVELLELYSTILGLGFKGRHARGGEPERAALMAALDAQIASLRPMPVQRLIIEATRDGRLDWVRRLPLWACVALAAAATLFLYLTLDRSLDAQLADLLRQTP